MMFLSTRMTEILSIYCKVAKSKKVYPTRAQMREAGVGDKAIRYNFGNITKLKTAAKEVNPQAFEKILDDESFNSKSYDELTEKISKYKRFVITTAISENEVHEEFYSSIKTYCKENKALLLILPVKDSNSSSYDIDSKLDNEQLVFGDVKLNSNLFISSIKINAKAIDPITGLGRLGQRAGSFIFSSPKQRLKMVPTSNTKLSHALMSTGAITKPDYNVNKYFNERTSFIAKNDHVIGAIIVEIEDNQYFHFRQIQADKDGSFIDVGIKYNKEIISYGTECIVLGDLHSGETDPEVKKITIEMIKELKPNVLVIHDLLNSYSISHHDINKSISLSIKAKENKLSLENELSNVAKDLNELTELVNEVVIVKSNHDEHLDRYLQEGRFINDPYNYKISLQLALAMTERENPIKWSMENIFKIKNKEKIKWLERDHDYKIAGVQLAAHSDKGSNGSKGSIQNMEMSYSNCIIGHSHTCQILRNVWSVGTSTYLKLNYNKDSASSWTHTHCLLNNNGSRQLINIIDGKWKL